MNGPIIITGAPRSGTSILGEVFNRHPDTDYYFETFRHRFGPFMLGSHRLKAHEALTDGQARAIREEFPTPNGKTIVVKDPQLLDHFIALRQIWPDCRVVLIERDLRDVACSIASAIEAGKSPALAEWLKTSRLPAKLESRYSRLTTRCAALCAMRWRLATCGIYGVGAYRISYAEMIADPISVLLPLFDKLGLGWPTSVNAFMNRISDDVTIHVAKRSASLFVADHQTRVGRWKSEFTDDEKRFLLETWFDYDED